LACAATLAGLLAPKAAMAAPSQAVTAVTFIDVIPNQFVAGNEDKAHVLLEKMNADTQGDSGLVSFSILQESAHPNHFTLYEVWKNSQAFESHTQAAHTLEFRNDLQPLIGSPYETLVTTPVR
jgi:quinol monooxygenase YgiN